MRAGRKGPSPLTAKRELYRRLMEQGVSNAEACRVVGVNRRTGTRWLHGRKYTNRAGEQWQYPPITAVPDADGADDDRKPRRFLTEFERVRIADLRREGRKAAEIAAILKRSPATIGRELDRNSDPVTGEYHPHAAPSPHPTICMSPVEWWGLGGSTAR